MPWWKNACQYIKFDEEVGFLYYDHCNVSKHHDKQDEPIWIKYLQLRILSIITNKLMGQNLEIKNYVVPTQMQNWNNLL